MGCLQSKEKDGDPTPMKEPEAKKIDKRLPFDTYRQFFNTRNSWKVITRSMEATAKDNLLRFFKKHPEHKALHKSLAKYTDDDKMAESTDFEISSMSVYNTVDMFMEKAESNPDEAISSLHRAGRMHVKIKDFDCVYFKDMEDSFIEAASETMGERFNDSTEKNFRILYAFVVEQMTEGYNKSVGKSGGEANRV